MTLTFIANSGTISEYLKRIALHMPKSGMQSNFWVRLINDTLILFGQDGQTSLSAEITVGSVSGDPLPLGKGFIIDRSLLEYLSEIPKQDVTFQLTPPESVEDNGSLLVDGAEFYVKSDFDYVKPPEDSWEHVATFGGLNFVQQLEIAAKFTTKVDATAGVFLRFDKGKAALYATDRCYAFRAHLDSPQSITKPKDLIFAESYISKIAAILSEKISIYHSKTTEGYFQIQTGSHKLTFGSGKVSEYPINNVLGAFGHRDEVSVIFERRELVNAMSMALIFIKNRAHNPVDISFNREDLTFTISVSGTTGKTTKTYPVVGFNGEPDMEIPNLTLSANRIAQIAKSLKNTDMLALNLGGFLPNSPVVEFTEHPGDPKDVTSVVMAGIAPGNTPVETDESEEDLEYDEIDFDESEVDDE